MSFTRTLIVSALMILTMVCLRFLSHTANIRPNKPFSTFPKQIGEWVGKENRFDEEVYKKLGVDDSFLGNYHNPNGSYINLYVGFYQSQKKDELIHSPKNCMPGAGWNVFQSSVEDLIIPNSNPGKIKMIKLILQKGNQKQIMLYWFQSRGRIITSEYMQKIYLVIDSITKNRTDGSFVRLISPTKNGVAEKTLQQMKDFAKLLMPVLEDYIPS